MPSIRDMLKAHSVIARLSTNPNLFVTTSYKFLPIMEFLDGVADGYAKARDVIIQDDTDVDQKEKALNDYLDSEVNLPSVQIGVNSLRNCGLTMIDLRDINWWLVEFVDEYED